MSCCTGWFTQGQCRGRWKTARLVLGLSMAVLAACSARPYRSGDVAAAPFLQRGVTQESGLVRVTAAVPNAGETLALTGLDLYEQGIQPIWLEIDNRSEHALRIAHWSIDPYYFSAIEVAYMNRKPFSDSGYAAMEKWFHDNALTRRVPAGERRSGLVFTHLTPGTKGFNLDLFGDRRAHQFTFFVPLPGFTADYMLVDFANLYSERDIRRFDTREGLRTYLEHELSCCATDANASGDGGPLNAVIVGSAPTLRRALLRGGWHETRGDSDDLQAARQHHYQGRPPDGVFYMDRQDSQQRMQLHLWRAPFEVDGEPGWLGQVYYRHLHNEFLRLLGFDRSTSYAAIRSQLARESVAADVDSAQRYLVQNFWYNQSLRALGLTGGVGESRVDNPRVTFDEIAYITGGQRAVLFLSETPVSIEDVELLFLQAPPKAEGSTP
ncbi:hypothetical protein [Parahaliea mediterranea]|uniref:LssY-like C-terminal domain-containing protein n=1 Tax=Parahaliea mediterranea TaxID=651086 RepID=A0A939DGH3_9GAMM|nr:hypothetical protein [Parahaliea mediterranea]MBN7797736.1 hypothetical protein [Parahaliea mediterranea]